MLTLQAAARALCGGLFLAIAAASGAQAQAWLDIDLPGSNGQVNQPVAINANSTIAGYYWKDDVNHPGFLRASDGTITTFVPVDGGDTTVAGMNGKDDVVGQVFAGGKIHGFLRTADGTVTLIDLSNINTPTCVNDRGDVGGYYYAGSSQYLGFIRHSDGSVDRIPAPDGTSVILAAINARGVAAGTYGSNQRHGFVRSRLHGKLTTFDIPGATSVYVSGITRNGTVAGYYSDNDGLNRGFLRAADGTLTTFDAVPSTTFTLVWGINDKGVVVGSYRVNGTSHGFARSPAGEVTTLDAPAAVRGTEIRAISPNGKMLGIYWDANNTGHVVRANAALAGF